MLGTLGAGYLLGWLWPDLHNSGPQLLIWGFCISTVLVYQFTFAVNSLGHRVGTRRFETNDASHNNWWLALAMLGEGGTSTITSSRVALVRGSADRLVRDLRPVPPTILAESRHRTAAQG